ncbi:hypothetical protein [Marinoscillum luteum]|uniref:PLAT domain-containing protein n=1 Tax=Marinoscillum luteum TaxID=861051 RepID=A0ABW7NE01_9BACT
MTKNEIIIKVIAIDGGDDTIQFQLYVSNGTCSSTIEVYGYSDLVTDFGKELTEFPVDINHKVIFEHGEKDRNWACFVSLTAKCIEPNGKSILDIEMINYGDQTVKHSSAFTMIVEPASINNLGTQLANWNPKNNSELSWPNV